MGQCPKCKASIDADFGIVTCPQCNTVLSIDINDRITLTDDPNALLSTDKYPSKENEFLTQPAGDKTQELMNAKIDDYQNDLSLKKDLITGQPLSENLGGGESFGDLPEFEPRDESPDDGQKTIQLQSSVPSQDSISNPNQEGPDVPEESVDAPYENNADVSEHIESLEQPQFKNEHLNEIANFANSEVTWTKTGAYYFNLTIGGIDSSDLREQIRWAITDERFRWNVDSVMRHIFQGQLKINKLNAAKTSVLVGRLKGLPLTLSWQQYSFIKSEK